MTAGESSEQGRAARRRRTRWPWMLGVGLVGMAGGLILYDVAVRPREGTTAIVQPRRITVAPDLKDGDVIPAQPGDLAGANVLIVTYDTTRADRIGCYGCDEAKTPAVDAMARDGILFSRAFTPSPTTLPSHASLMTGLYPYHHGARANNVFHLHDEHTTLAEVLGGNGYRTAAFISTFVLDDQFGIDQGFQHFDDKLDAVSDASPHLVSQRTADKTFRAADAWLRAAGDGPFFLWVHYYDPHFPYEAPKAFSDDHMVPYDAEIAFTDFHFGKLLKTLNQLELADDTLVVMFGDHGEGLGQHDEATHGCLVYDSVMRVPLVMRCGTKLGGGIHIDRPVSLVDVMPTILSLLGLEGPGAMDGIDLTRAATGPRPIYLESLQGLADYGWAALLAVQEGSTKYIHGPQDELFDLAADPFERTDLSPTEPARIAAMHAHLEALYGDDLTAAVTARATHQLSDEDLRKLQSLGYLTSTNSLPDSSQRPHPRDMMPLLSRMLEAVAVAKTQGADESINQLEAIADAHPDFAPVWRQLGDSYRKKGDLDRAEEAYAACLEIQPGDLQPLMALAGVKLETKDVGGAVALYRQVLARDPSHFNAHMKLGRVLLSQGDYRDATDTLIAALSLRPGDNALPDMLTDAMLLANRAGEAEALLRELLETEPRRPMVRNALARVLTRQGRFADATVLLRTGLALSPGQPALTNNLCVILVSAPIPEIRDPWEAVTLMEPVCEETGYRDPRFLHTLSMGYGATGRIDEAITTAQRARRIATESGDPLHGNLVARIGSSIRGFREQKAQEIAAAATIEPPADTETTVGTDGR